MNFEVFPLGCCSLPTRCAALNLEGPVQVEDDEEAAESQVIHCDIGAGSGKPVPELPEPSHAGETLKAVQEDLWNCGCFCFIYVVSRLVKSCIRIQFSSSGGEAFLIARGAE